LELAAPRRRHLCAGSLTMHVNKVSSVKTISTPSAAAAFR
jgi:hypothetical protein